MKNTFLLAIMLLGSVSVFSQNVVVEASPALYDTTLFFTRVEKEAMFPGGLNGWRKYLEANLKGNLAADYIKLSRKQRIAQQTVSVQFIVSKEGKISNVRAINNAHVHPALAQEAIRVIRQGPDWIPAEQNNKKVIYQAIQNITFQVARN
ncbi:MAG TPA: energy transducer TonB [Segetibacter sp.]|jgi:protein TonB